MKLNAERFRIWRLLVGGECWGIFLVGGECLGNFMCVHVSGLWVSVNFIVWVYCVYTYNDNKLLL